jgi:outer membrane lipoprotein LolB
MIWRAAALLSVATLTACTSLTPPIADGRAERLIAVDEWRCRARVAVRTEAGGGQGNLEWQQQGDVSDIDLSGPFRAGALQIRATPEGATVKNSRGEIVQAMSGDGAAENLIEQALGWPFPANSARYWLLGVLDPSLPGDVVRGADGSLAGLNQRDWSVAYERFSEAGGERLPSKIVLKSSAARIRVVIHRWDI